MLSTLAPAKINLHLHVTGKRENGFHELDSLVCFANIGDTIHLESGSQFELQVTGEFAPMLTGKDLLTSRESNNSVIRAVWLLADKAEREPEFKIILEKNLPAGSGIGGGSADAAAMLKAQAEFWNLNISEDELSAMAQSLGSDVLACVKSSPILMQGIGDQILPAPVFPSLPAILIWPDQHVPTPLVYKNFKADFFSPNISFHNRYESPQSLSNDLKARTSNDLELTAIKLFPVIGQALERLESANGCLLSRMSGSGSTVFGLFGTQSQAEAAAKYIAQAHPNWWVRSCLLNGN